MYIFHGTCDSLWIPADVQYKSVTFYITCIIQYGFYVVVNPHKFCVSLINSWFCKPIYILNLFACIVVSSWLCSNMISRRLCKSVYIVFFWDVLYSPGDCADLYTYTFCFLFYFLALQVIVQICIHIHSMFFVLFFLGGPICFPADCGSLYTYTFHVSMDLLCFQVARTTVCKHSPFFMTPYGFQLIVKRICHHSISVLPLSCLYLNVQRNCIHSIFVVVCNGFIFFSIFFYTFVLSVAY